MSSVCSRGVGVFVQAQKNTNSTQTELTTGYPSAQIHFMSDWVRQSPHSIAAVLYFRLSQDVRQAGNHISLVALIKSLQCAVVPNADAEWCCTWLLDPGAKRIAATQRCLQHWTLAGRSCECLLHLMPSAKACWTCAKLICSRSWCAMNRQEGTLASRQNASLKTHTANPAATA